MDVRSEGLVDQFISTFEQVNLDFEHHFTDNFKITRDAGRSISEWDGPMRLQTFMDTIDVDNFTLDFRGGRETPLIGFGFDVSDPNQLHVCGHAGWPIRRCSAASPSRASRRAMSPANTMVELNGDWQMTDMFTVKGGLQ